MEGPDYSCRGVSDFRGYLRRYLAGCERLRAVHGAVAQGLDPAALAAELDMEPALVDELVASVQRGGDVEVTPSGLIVRATVEGGSGRELADALAGFAYDDEIPLPRPLHGVQSPWAAVERACTLQGFLSREELAEIVRLRGLRRSRSAGGGRGDARH